MRLRWFLAASFAAALALALPVAAGATLTASFSFNGKVAYSADGLGQNGTGGTVDAEVPAGSTVQKALLYGTYFFNEAPDQSERTINFDGTTVVLTQISSISGCCGLATARADVTSQVAGKVGSGGGRTPFAVNSDPSSLDGVALVVVYSNPSLPNGTVGVLDGSASPSGDTASFVLASPLDKTSPGFRAILSLGSGFSAQGDAPTAHSCGTGQFSTVDINNQRLTSCAGNHDDGLRENGALITVGGVDDLTDSPPNPNGPGGNDDELYDIAPFLAQGTTNIEIKTTNPSQDDNLFLAVISITAPATVTNEDCNNGVDDDGDGMVDGQDPDCIRGQVAARGTVASSATAASFSTIFNCSAGASTRPFYVRWKTSSSQDMLFQKSSVTSASCSNDPNINPTPSPGFDTITGTSEGTINGTTPARAEYTLTDRGASSADTVRIVVRDGSNNVLVTLQGSPGPLNGASGYVTVLPPPS